MTRRSNHRSFTRKLLGICLMGVAVILFTIVILLTPSQPFASTACACTPPPGGHPSYPIADHVIAADVVLEGTVTEVSGSWVSQEADVDVTQYFKDRGPETVTISGLGPDGSGRSGYSIRTDFRRLDSAPVI